MLIGLAGKAGVGKNTVANVFCDLADVPYAQLSIAQNIKFLISDLFDISLDDIEFMKNVSDSGHFIVLGRAWSMRRMLQEFGLSMRKNFGEDFWIDQVIPKSFRHDDTLFVVTDVRYQNEVDRIQQVGGKVVFVQGDGNGLSAVDSQHESESCDLTYDYVINNDRDDWDEVQRQVANILSWYCNPIDLTELGDGKPLNIITRKKD